MLHQRITRGGEEDRFCLTCPAKCYSVLTREAYDSTRRLQSTVVCRILRFSTIYSGESMLVAS